MANGHAVKNFWKLQLFWIWPSEGNIFGAISIEKLLEKKKSFL